MKKRTRLIEDAKSIGVDIADAEKQQAAERAAGQMPTPLTQILENKGYISLEQLEKKLSLRDVSRQQEDSK